MASTFAKHYLQPTALTVALTDRRQLNTTTPSGGADTGTSVQYAATTSGVKQWRPGTANNTAAATVPTANAVPTNKYGWRNNADLTPEKVVTIAGDWPVSARFTPTGQTTGPSADITFIAYLVSAQVDTTYTEIGRVTVATGLAWAGGVISGNLAAAAVTGPLNSRVEIHVYINVTVAHLGVSAMTISISTNSADTFLGPGTYTVLAETTGSAFGTGAATGVLGATGAMAGTATGTGTATGLTSAVAATTGTASGSGTATGVFGTIGGMVGTSSGVGTATGVLGAIGGMVGSAAGSGTAAGVLGATAGTTGTASGTGTAAGLASSVAGTVGTAAGSATTVGQSSIVLGTVGTVTPGGVPDWPLNAPTKFIAGVTRNSAGAVLPSCTVKLIRQSDDVMVASVTSDATTGAYSFTRGTDDPYSYRVLATKADVPEVHGVTDVLVPA